MKSEFQTKTGKVISLRPVGDDPNGVNAKDDFEFFFKTFVEASYDDVVKLAGFYPEKGYRDFCKAGFYSGNVHMLCDGDRRVGTFAINNHADRVEISFAYFDKEYRGLGLFKEGFLEAMQIANQQSKPLTLVVLASNDKALAVYDHMGFVHVSSGIYYGDASWARETNMMHKNTLACGGYDPALF